MVINKITTSTSTLASGLHTVTAVANLGATITPTSSLTQLWVGVDMFVQGSLLLILLVALFALVWFFSGMDTYVLA